jgi:hypothetical protein
MALKGVLCRKHKIEWYRNGLSIKEPIRVRLIDVDVGRLIWWWRVDIGISGVNFDAEVAFVRAYRKENSHTWLFDG